MSAETGHFDPCLWPSVENSTARTIPISLDLFHDWSRPEGSRYQHGFSTRSGNDGK